jgi:hypothetical protein
VIAWFQNLLCFHKCNLCCYVTAKLDDDTFDAAIHKLLRAEGEAVEPDPADDLPPKVGGFTSRRIQLTHSLKC